MVSENSRSHTAVPASYETEKTTLRVYDEICTDFKTILVLSRGGAKPGAHLAFSQDEKGEEISAVTEPFTNSAVRINHSTKRHGMERAA